MIDRALKAAKTITIEKRIEGEFSSFE